MAWFRKKVAPAAPTSPAPAHPPLPPEELRVGGVTIQLIGEWQQVDVEPDGRIEFRSSSLPEQLFVMERRLNSPVEADELRSVLLSMTEHCRSALLTAAPSAVFEAVDYRTGSGQGEARLIATAPGMQAAFLHRGDAGRVVSISLYRYTPEPGKFAQYAGAVFDFVRFDATPT